MTFYRCLDFTKKYFLFKWLPLGNHNFRQIIPETFILNTRENLVPWGKITFYIYALQTHPLCRYWNHLASQAPFPWDSKCYLKVIIGTYLSKDRYSCETNSYHPMLYPITLFRWFSRPTQLSFLVTLVVSAAAFPSFETFKRSGKLSLWYVNLNVKSTPTHLVHNSYYNMV